MVDRTQRDSASRVLQSFIDGVITNDDFEAQYPRLTSDPAIPAIKANIWMLYSDLHQHRITAEHALTNEQREIAQRCVLFLTTNLEFEWPVPEIKLSNLFTNLFRKLKKRARTAEATTVPSDADSDVWPFFRKRDYDAYAVS
jgi:hypothetical protein